jgi:hypothetical protein
VGRRAFRHRRLIVGGDHQAIVNAIDQKDTALIVHPRTARSG